MPPVLLASALLFLPGCPASRAQPVSPLTGRTHQFVREDQFKHFGTLNTFGNGGTIDLELNEDTDRDGTWDTSYVVPDGMVLVVTDVFVSYSQPEATPVPVLKAGVLNSADSTPPERYIRVPLLLNMPPGTTSDMTVAGNFHFTGGVIYNEGGEVSIRLETPDSSSTTFAVVVFGYETEDV